MHDRLRLERRACGGSSVKAGCDQGHQSFGPGDVLFEVAGPQSVRGGDDPQHALAWLLAQRDDIVPIPGTRSPARVEENVAAVDITLSSTDLADIDRILPHGGFGARYSEASLPTWH